MGGRRRWRSKAEAFYKQRKKLLEQQIEARQATGGSGCRWRARATGWRGATISMAPPSSMRRRMNGITINLGILGARRATMNKHKHGSMRVGEDVGPG